MIMPESERFAVTYVVPTYNRPEFLHRLLEFFAQAELKNPIVIADSSNSEKHFRNRQLVMSYQNRLQIDYFHEDIPLIEKISAALYRVKSPCLTFCADDDFAFPSIVDQCGDFLMNHPDFAVAQGRVVNASNTNSIRSSTYACEVLNSYSMTQDSAADRFSTMASNSFSTFYAIHRTNLARRQFDLTAKHTDYQSGRVFTESLLIGLSVIAGKVMVFPEIHYIQQVHGANDSCRLSRISDRSQKDAMYSRYKAALTQEIQAETNLTEAAAGELVENCISLLPGFTKRKKSRVGPGQKIVRELGRVIVRLARAFSRRAVSGTVRADSTAELRNAHLIPSGPVYQLAFQMLSEYPEGIRTELQHDEVAA